MSKVQALSGIVGDSQRQVIHAVVDKIAANPGEKYALQLMPITDQPASILYHEVVSAFGGKTGERTLGEKGKAVHAGDSEIRPFIPGSYQEHVKFTEKDLLTLRKLGTMGDRGVTGVTDKELNWLERGANKLNLRIENRCCQLVWDAIFNGKFIFKGAEFDFKIPLANFINATTDWSVSASATPFKDLMTILKTHAVVRKYKIKQIVINPKTEVDMLTSAEAKSVIVNANIDMMDVNKVGKFLYPGLPEIKVVADSYQDEAIAGGKVSLTNAQFFVPDDKALLIPDFGGTLYGQYGELQITENINDPSATLDNPATGIYTFVDEKGLEERESPYVKVVAGFNGGPNLMRSDDVIIVSV